MTPERYRQIGELYHAALEADAAERAALLERACSGDEELRREVESLINSHEQAADFIAEPALAVASELLAESEAAALTGRTIARYRVLSLIGTGGMGQVYLAEDTELVRRVALKFLPEYFTHNKDQVQRFRQEARAASALNHPNILTVYEVGQVDDTEFIATEYVEGETLRARLSRAPFDMREALDVASQIADALVAAHAGGIVHRDIKPENVMLRTDGYVKVLDFGLAKLTENLAGFGSAKCPAGSVINTNPGMVMGTAEYMSPEQARALAVDTRTDVWSLGVVLYEMMAGRRPFAGATHGDTIVSILDREPTPLVRHAPEAPPELERIVTKALAKDTEGRYQTVKEMALDLRRLRRRLEVEAEREGPALISQSGDETTAISNGARPAATATDAQAAARVSEGRAARATSSVEFLVSEITKHKRGAMLFGSVLILLLGGVSYVLYRLPSQPEQSVAPFQTVKMTRVTSTGKAKDAAISPDGKYVAYMEEDAKGQSLWIKQVTAGSSVLIVPPADVTYWGLTFSNDSNYLYYVRSEKDISLSVLYQVSALGGASKKLLEHLDSAVTFSPDGQRLAFVRGYRSKKESALIVVKADGSGERLLATRHAPEAFSMDNAIRIAWSPDGKVIACPVDRTDADGLYSYIVSVQVEDGATKLLTHQRWSWASQVAWLSGGSGLVVLASEKSETLDGGALWHISYPGGAARQITNDLEEYIAVSSATDSNTLIALQKNRVCNIWVVPKADLSSARQITSGTHDGFQGLAWTPDGRVLYRSNASGTKNIWVMDADGSNQRQLTHDGVNFRPAVSHSGRYIVFTSARTGKENNWRMDMDGGNQKRLTDGKADSHPHLSPDESWVIYQSWDDGLGSLWKIPIDGGKALQLNDTHSNYPVVSPDGKQIACFYWDEQANPPSGVMLLPFAGGQPTRRFNIASTYDGFALSWALDGRALLYIDTRLSNIWSQPIDGGPPVQLTDFRGDHLFNFAYSPDGNWLALARGRVTSDVVMISDLR
jgi:eukaryotic-like serine/threonine-protein kinase